MSFRFRFNMSQALVESALRVEHKIAGEDELTRWDWVPAALADQIQRQVPDGVAVEGVDCNSMRVFEYNKLGSILPPSERAKEVYEAVVAALQGSGVQVRYEALNGTWNNLEAQQSC